MSGLATRLRTLLALGPASVARVGAYRLGLRSGMNPVKRLTATAPKGQFFAPVALPPVDAAPTPRWTSNALHFGWKETPLVDGRPDWLTSPFGTGAAMRADAPWWEIPDFDPAVGDIKGIWEASRFDWAIAHAERARNGEAEAMARLNDWIADWVAVNPPYRGPNWKCGQEASIRVMHLAAAALILHQTQAPQPALAALLVAHLRRIRPTVSYAVGQDNNHGTSEAAALFIGGAWLAAQGQPGAAEWHRRGRALLEERGATLIAPDGTFSQYSVTYHRLMLDTFSLVEVWRKRHGLANFSPSLRRRLAAAARWLRELTDPASGDAPNLGANDGARLIPLTDTDYRDFRPSVQLASALFVERRAIAAAGPWDAALRWLEVEPPQTPADTPASRLLDDGGLALLRDARSLAVLRFPRFRFRPGHADALHVDLWRDGENLLRDGGSYSYADAAWNSYFAGTEAHNTIQFDDRDQMPRLGRFLFGDWLTTENVTPPTPDQTGHSVSASYRDGKGARHARRLSLAADGLSVVDDISGPFERAVLRWRLAPGDWQVAGNSVTNGRDTLTVEATMPIRRIELVAGQESRHYLAMTELPVFEIEVAAGGRLTSHYAFAT